MNRLFVAACLVLTLGCGRNPQPPVSFEIPPSEFRTNLSLQWPADPGISVWGIDDQRGRDTTYLASASKKFPDGMLFFQLTIWEMPSADLQGYTPFQMLESHNPRLKDGVTNRRAIKHGPKQYPGLAIDRIHTGLEIQSWVRTIDVLAGRRFYTVSATASKNKELLDRPEVIAFFESFKIED